MGARDSLALADDGGGPGRLQNTHTHTRSYQFAAAITGNTSHKWALDDSLITHIWLLERLGGAGGRGEGGCCLFVHRMEASSRSKAARWT